MPLIRMCDWCGKEQAKLVYVRVSEGTKNGKQVYKWIKLGYLCEECLSKLIQGKVRP